MVLLSFQLEEGRVNVVAQCTVCNSEGEVHDKEFDDYFDSYVSLSHCSSTDYHLGAVFSGMEDKPNPVGA